MQPLMCRSGSGRNQNLIPPAILLCMAVAIFLAAEFPAPAGGMAPTATEGHLRAAWAGGGTVTFAGDGTSTPGQTITNSVDCES
jgi:hypothetical protein